MAWVKSSLLLASLTTPAISPELATKPCRKKHPTKTLIPQTEEHNTESSQSTPPHGIHKTPTHSNSFKLRSNWIKLTGAIAATEWKGKLGRFCVPTVPETSKPSKRSAAKQLSKPGEQEQQNTRRFKQRKHKLQHARICVFESLRDAHRPFERFSATGMLLSAPITVPCLHHRALPYHCEAMCITAECDVSSGEPHCISKTANSSNNVGTVIAFH